MKQLVTATIILLMVCSCKSNKEDTTNINSIPIPIDANYSLPEVETKTVDTQVIQKTIRYAFVLLTVEKEKEVTDGAAFNRNIDKLRESGFDSPSPKLESTSKIKKFRYYYVTDIKTLNNPTEDDKYRLMDEVQTDPMVKYNIQSYQTHNGIDYRIVDRKCLVFDTYSEASKEREKYSIKE